MADATGVCYTQSGNVKRYEHEALNYIAFIRSGNEYLDGLNNDMDYLVSYQYSIWNKQMKLFSYDYYDVNFETDLKGILSYTVDNTNNECNFTINPGGSMSHHWYDPCDATPLLTFFRITTYSPSMYDMGQCNPTNDLIFGSIDACPTTLRGLTEGKDYICVKYSYGTPEYNELVSYIHTLSEYGNMYPELSTTLLDKVFTLRLCNKEGTDDKSELSCKDGYNSTIKNFMITKNCSYSFFPDIIVYENYAAPNNFKVNDFNMSYLLNDMHGCNLYLYGVVKYGAVKSDNWSTTATITVMSFGEDNIVGTNGKVDALNLNLYSSSPLIIRNGIGGDIIIDSNDLTNKETSFEVGPTSSVINIGLSTHQHSRNVLLCTSNITMLSVKIEFGKGTKWTEDINSNHNYKLGNLEYYGVNSLFDPNSSISNFLDDNWEIYEDDPVGPYFVNAFYENTPNKPYVWNGLGNSCLSGVIIHNIYNDPDNGATAIGYFVLGVEQNGNKFYLTDTDTACDINSWTLYVESTNENNIGTIPFSGFILI